MIVVAQELKKKANTNKLGNCNSCSKSSGTRSQPSCPEQAFESSGLPPA